jgi:hypothetical protein
MKMHTIPSPKRPSLKAAGNGPAAFGTPIEARAQFEGTNWAQTDLGASAPPHQDAEPEERHGQGKQRGHQHELSEAVPFLCFVECCYICPYPFLLVFFLVGEPKWRPMHPADWLNLDVDPITLFF